MSVVKQILRVVMYGVGGVVFGYAIGVLTYLGLAEGEFFNLFLAAMIAAFGLRLLWG